MSFRGRSLSSTAVGVPVPSSVVLAAALLVSMPANERSALWVYLIP